jgi:Tol biopolymer transport system component
MYSDGTNETQLSNSDASDPAWSPDGTEIAFYSLRSGNFDIYVMNADGSGQKQLTINSAGNIWPDW